MPRAGVVGIKAGCILQAGHYLVSICTSCLLFYFVSSTKQNRVELSQTKSLRSGYEYVLASACVWTAQQATSAT